MKIIKKNIKINVLVSAQEALLYQMIIIYAHLLALNICLLKKITNVFLNVI